MKKKNSYLLRNVTAILLLICFQVSFGQTKISKLQAARALAEFSKSPLMKHASITFSIVDLNTGEEIVSYDKHRALIPASSAKLFSCAIILNELSDSFKYHTIFNLKGKKIDDTIFNGNLEIIGSGDPSFGSNQLSNSLKFQQMVDSVYRLLKEKKISRLTGEIIIDQHFIQDIPENPEWLWYDLGNYYGCGSYAFNFMENQGSITLAGSAFDGEVCPIIRIVPEQLSQFYTSKVIGRNIIPTDELYVIGSSQSTSQSVHGEWKCCVKDTIMIRTAIPDPAKIFSMQLELELAKKGIIFEHRQNNMVANSEKLLNITSPPLGQLINRALLKSVNLYCESFLHSFGWQLNGTSDRKKALQKLNQQMTAIIKSENGFILEDASGLSPKNMLSAAAGVSILQWIYKQKSLLNYWKLLPDNSQQGSLATKLKQNTNYQWRLKSGAMERVKAYSGFIIKNDKPAYALSLMVNHYTCSGEAMNNTIAHFFNQLIPYN